MTTIKINLDQLIWTVQNHFENEKSYIIECKKKPYYKRTQEEDKLVTWHERNRNGSWNSVVDITNILNIEYSNLCTIARLALKWEQKHDWQLCFPAQAHEDQILKYLAE